MTDYSSNDNIDRYIKEISNLLPYSDEQKSPILAELRKDVLDAIRGDKRPPSVVFGSPHEVAANISISHKWGTELASWRIRVMAFLVDFFIITVCLVLFFIFPLSQLISDINTRHGPFLYSITFFFGLPVLIISLMYFFFLERAYSTTLGKKIFGLLVIDESGIRITWTQALTRNITKISFIGQFLIFDVLIGMFSKKTRNNNQRVLDFVSGTLVVKKTR